MTQSAGFLAKIIDSKRQRLAPALADGITDNLREQARSVRRAARSHRFRAALEEKSPFGIIAEFKRASPSKGEINTNTSVTAAARAYEAGGAAAISVLTEEDYFRGTLDDLRAAGAAAALPRLRKDFIISEYQIYETAAAGADALLLIAAALDDKMLARLRDVTETELEMDALVEVHTEEEMQRARACGATVIGVNNRDLRTFAVSLDVSRRLAAQAPRDSLLISESGLRDASDLRALHAHGYRGFLIGETLMRAADPENALRALLRDASMA